jgi:hypothetical protein
MQTYQAKWYSDPGHEWLQVEKKDCVALGITGKVSECSYHKGQHAYLEGDCDAPLFYNAVEALGGVIDMGVEVSANDDSPVREMSRITSRMNWSQS